MAVNPEQHLACFKAYDIRGKVPDELDIDRVTKIARAYAQWLKPSRVVVGYDIRLSSPEIADAVARGLNDEGVDVVELGLCGTEHVYFATFHHELDGGIMVTASHNPAEYNGLKPVRELARPLSSVSGLGEIEQEVIADSFGPAPGGGGREPLNVMQDYIQHLLTYIDVAALPPMKIVTNPGNGGAGRVIDALDPHLPFTFERVHHEPDGKFPNGVPNPLLPDNRQVTRDAVLQSGATMGVAWDGDFDRCFLFDETGGFIEGYYIVGLLAESILSRNPGGKIVHDPRLTWNTLETVEAAGGIAVQSKSGHAFVKDVMRREDAVYGGEMSAHHFFREFSYCDSGMVPWMLVAALVASRGKPLSALVSDRMERFPASGEINRRVDDADVVIERIKDEYGPDALKIDETDGVGIDFESWRFNLRKSNTEPLIRLNVETRGDRALMEARTEELLSRIV
ncbi:MAG: phosphomannomutase [Acidobacteriota bacterium]|nr:phosphomannomutase [Acidobacteriota bacterium]MDH3784277.1 phosphomannomutase [Acidobacteriota bacterium]